MGEREQAQKAGVKAVTTAPAQVAAIVQDSDTESDASATSIEQQSVMGFALPFLTATKTAKRPQTVKLDDRVPISNVFDLLNRPDDDQDEDDESSMVHAISQFAHKVKHVSKIGKTQKKQASLAPRSATCMLRPTGC